MEACTLSATLTLAPSSIQRRRRSTTISSLSPLSSISSSSSSFLTSNNSVSSLRYGGSFQVQVRTRSRRRSNSNRSMKCNCLFGLGVPELVVIAGVVALVFGPKKLPEVGRSIGKTVKSFQQAAKEFETELKKEPDSALDSPAETSAAATEEEKEDNKATSTKGNS